MERPCPRCGGPRNLPYYYSYCGKCKAAYERKYQQLYRHGIEEQFKNQSRNAVRNAVKAGKLFRKPCQLCNESSQDAHHQDYTKPLEVIWLCRRCHKLIHRNVYATNGAAERVNWEVLWVSKGTIHTKEFDHDLASALELRDKLIAGERQNVTLRSMNMGFPPPDRYADHTSQGALIEPREYEHRMALINLKGLWWCCYCLKLRRFEKTDCFVIDGIQVDEPAMSCPLCGASNRLNTIQKYNPKSARYTELRRTRSDKGASR